MEQKLEAIIAMKELSVERRWALMWLEVRATTSTEEACRRYGTYGEELAKELYLERYEAK